MPYLFFSIAYAYSIYNYTQYSGFQYIDNTLFKTMINKKNGMARTLMYNSDDGHFWRTFNFNEGFVVDEKPDQLVKAIEENKKK